MLCSVYKQTYFSLLNHTGDFGKIHVERINLTPNQIGVLVKLSSWIIATIIPKALNVDGLPIPSFSLESPYL